MTDFLVYPASYAYFIVLGHAMQCPVVRGVLVLPRSCRNLIAPALAACILLLSSSLLWVQAVDALLQDYLQIEVCLRCSAQRLLAVRDVFSFAIKMVMYPMAPLFDKTEQSLRPLCIKALLRVFNICDADQVPLLCMASLLRCVFCMVRKR